MTGYVFDNLFSSNILELLTTIITQGYGVSQAELDLTLDQFKAMHCGMGRNLEYVHLFKSIVIMD